MTKLALGLAVLVSLALCATVNVKQYMLAHLRQKV
jgi:hypothetical protein